MLNQEHLANPSRYYNNGFQVFDDFGVHFGWYAICQRQQGLSAVSGLTVTKTDSLAVVT